MGQQAKDNESGIQLHCDWRFAFNLKSSQKGTVGYISDWRGLGGLALEKDIVLWSPVPGSTSPLPKSLQGNSGSGVADQVQCVAVIESLEFGGESWDPIRVVCYVSKDNQVKLRYKLVRPLLNTQLKLDYALLGYDEDSKGWYSAFELDNAPSVAQVNTSDGALQLFVDFEPTAISETLDINVYRMEFQIIPTETTTRLKLATGPKHRYVTEWQE
jgi:hypothetical protein